MQHDDDLQHYQQVQLELELEDLELVMEEEDYLFEVLETDLDEEYE